MVHSKWERKRASHPRYSLIDSYPTSMASIQRVAARLMEYFGFSRSFAVATRPRCEWVFKTSERPPKAFSRFPRIRQWIVVLNAFGQKIKFLHFTNFLLCFVSLSRGVKCGAYVRMYVQYRIKWTPPAVEKKNQREIDRNPHWNSIFLLTSVIQMAKTSS